VSPLGLLQMIGFFMWVAIAESEFLFCSLWSICVFGFLLAGALFLVPGIPWKEKGTVCFIEAALCILIKQVRKRNGAVCAVRPAWKAAPVVRFFLYRHFIGTYQISLHFQVAAGLL